MANELIKATRGSLVKPDTTMTYEGGKLLLKASAGGGALWLAAGFLPFITFPIMIVIAIIAGMMMLAAG